MKRLAAALATVGLLAAVLWASREPRLSGPAATTPEGCIERMFHSAEQGDVDAYLDCFAGPERERLDRDLALQSPAAFAQALTEAVRSLKGRAMVGGDAPTGADRAELSVERVYAQRNELQTYDLRRQGGVWRIFAVRSAQKIQPPIPFGTPVFGPPTEDAENPGR